MCISLLCVAVDLLNDLLLLGRLNADGLERLVPQSGQMSVSLSSLESAGAPW